jgi:adenylylsulfate kinase
MNFSKKNLFWQFSSIKRENRCDLNGHSSAVLWFTGLSGAGKSTLAHEVEKRLFALGIQVYALDGDNVRHGLCGDLGFSVEDRIENIRRIGEVAKLFMEAGFITLTAFISPYRIDREYAKNLIGKENFVEIYCQCPLEICEERDVKGLYQRARLGIVKNFTGISSDYEEPLSPALVVNTAQLSLEESANLVIRLLQKNRIIHN